MGTKFWVGQYVNMMCGSVRLVRNWLALVALSTMVCVEEILDK